MRKSAKFSILFSILILNFCIITQSVSGYWEVNGNTVIYDVSIDDYYYVHNQTSYNSSLVYIRIFHNRSNFFGYNVVNPVHINTTLIVNCLMEDSGSPDPEINLQFDILQNLADVYTRYDTLEENWIPETADEFQWVITDDYLQREVLYDYIVLNVTSNSTYTSDDFVILIWGYSFYRGMFIGYVETTLFLVLAEFIPLFLMIIIFPIIFYSAKINKKISLILGIFASAFCLGITGLISFDTMVILYIAAGLLGYLYLKFNKSG